MTKSPLSQKCFSALYSQKTPISCCSSSSGSRFHFRTAHFEFWNELKSRLRNLGKNLSAVFRTLLRSATRAAESEESRTVFPGQLWTKSCLLAFDHFLGFSLQGAGCIRINGLFYFIIFAAALNWSGF